MSATTVTGDPSGAGDFSSITAVADPNAPNSPITLDYWRGKLQAVQVMLDNLDNVYLQLAGMGDTVQGDPDLLAEWQDLMDDFESKRSTVGTLVEGLNLASQSMNAIGVPMPSLTVSGLSGAPLILAGAAGLLITADYFLNWSGKFFQAVTLMANHAYSLLATLALPDDQRAAAQAQINATASAATAAMNAQQNSTVANVMSLAKLALFAGLAWMAYKVWRETQ